MKTIEQKAKAYDKARERAEKVLKTQYTAHWDKHKELIEHLFPELAESEDERIRKHLIGVVELYYGYTDEQEKKDCLAWLEKQGDIPAGAVLDSNKDGLIADTFNTKGEQKPWSEEDESMLFNVIHRIEQLDHYWNKPTDEKMIDWLKSLKDRCICRLSEEQIKICKEVYADILSAKGFEFGTVNSELNRLGEELKKLKG